MLDFTRRANDFLQGLQAKQFKQVTGKILALLKDPYPQDCKHLAGHPGFRRVDVGEFRVCYKISESVIYVAVVGRRNDDAVYKELARTNY